MNFLFKKTSAALMAAIMMVTSVLALYAVDQVEVHAATRIPVEEIEYDPEDREVSFEFYTGVQYRRVKVYIYYKKSKKNYARYIIERDDDGLEVKVKPLKYGRKYKYKIKGIKRYGDRKYVTTTGTFRAIDG